MLRAMDIRDMLLIDRLSADAGGQAPAILVDLMAGDQALVILAEGPDDLARLFAGQPGLASQFPTSVAFDDYADDLAEVGGRLYHFDCHRVLPLRLMYHDRGGGNCNIYT